MCSEKWNIYFQFDRSSKMNRLSKGLVFTEQLYLLIQFNMVLPTLIKIYDYWKLNET
jgi:hypothetical protein